MEKINLMAQLLNLKTWNFFRLFKCTHWRSGLIQWIDETFVYVMKQQWWYRLQEKQDFYYLNIIFAYDKYCTTSHKQQWKHEWRDWCCLPYSIDTIGKGPTWSNKLLEIGLPMVQTFWLKIFWISEINFLFNSIFFSRLRSCLLILIQD